MPKSRDPKDIIGQDLPMTFPTNSISGDFQAFDNLIKSQGVRLKHMRAIIDPRGLQSRGDIRRAEPVSNTDGFIYKEAGTFIAIVQSADKAPLFEVEGIIDAANAMMTPPRFYESDSDEQKPVIIDVGDRFEIQDVEVRVTTKELVTANSIGLDRLTFPATCVEHLIGSDGFEYIEDKHYQITKEGHIKWISQTRPGIDTKLNKGEVYSIRYRYIPYYTARRIVNEIRVQQKTDPITGQRFTERLPYQVQIARENVFKDQNRTSEAPQEDPRFQNIPDGGGLRGPRGGT